MQPARTASGSPVRVGVIDNDSSLLRPLSKRLNGVGRPHRVFGSAVPPDALARMRLDVVVIDPAVVAPHAWRYLEELSAQLPHLGVIVCGGPSSVAQRVRALRLGTDDWITKPCHPEEVIARVEAVVRRRRRHGEQVSPKPLGMGEIEISRTNSTRPLRARRST